MLPADKTVHIVKKENGEVHHNGNICRILQRGQRPQYNEYDVIGGISQRIIRRTKHGQGSGQKTCDDGYCAEYNVGSVQCCKNQIKYKCDNNTDTTNAQ